MSLKVSSRPRRRNLLTMHVPRRRGPWNLAVALAAGLVLTTPVIGAAGGRESLAPAGAIVVASSGPTSISLSWGGSPDRKVAGYDVYSNGSFAGHTRETRYTAEGLRCGTTYSAAVLAYDRAGNRSSPTEAIVATAACPDTERPSAPGNLAQAARTPTSISLTWRPATDNTAVTGYGVYVNDAVTGQTTQLVYVAEGLACGKSYTLAVDAVDAAGNRSSRASAVMSTSACSASGGGDSLPPSNPSGMVVSSVTTGGMTLSWSASNDNVAVSGYDVYAGAQKVGTTTSTSRVITGLACGAGYTLGVEAFDSAGNRSARATLPASTTPCPATSGDDSADLFVAPGGSDAGVCSRVAPCASFGRAYQVAVPGSVVEVAAGSYPRQTLVFDPSKTSSLDVVFRPAVGAAVTLAEFATGANRVRVGAQHFELRDFTVSSYVRLWWGSEDVTLRNIDAAGIDFASARDVRVLGGDFGPLVDQVSHVRSCGEPGCYPAEDILIEGALFHDYTISYADKHSECLMIWPGRRVTIRNSTFRNCTDFDVFVKPGYELRFENNFFDEPMPGDSATVECNPNCPRGGPALSFSDGSGMTVRYNSFLGAIRLDPEVAGPNSFTGNAGRAAGCWTNATFTYNLWASRPCSASDRTAPLTDLFLDPTSSGFDLRLKPGSPAVGAGNPGDYPVDDIDGDRRPMGGSPDAGADEQV